MRLTTSLHTSAKIEEPRRRLVGTPVALAAVLLAAAVVNSTGATSESSTVSDDALLHIGSMNVEPAGYAANTAGAVELSMWLLPTADAPPGNITAHVKIDITAFQTDAPQATLAKDWTVEVPEEGTYQGDEPLTFQWEAPRGVWRFTATLYEDSNATDAWDKRDASWQQGWHDDLLSGWGEASYGAVASADFDEDGTVDMRLTNRTTGQPVEWSVDASTGMHIDSYDQEESRTFRISFWKTHGGTMPATDGTVSEDVVRRMLRIGADDEVIVQDAYREGTPVLQGDTYYFEIPWYGEDVQHFGGNHDFGFQYIVKPTDVGTTSDGVWYDGFRTHVNVTHWDVDEDGTADLGFYNSTAGSPDEAASQNESDRRTDPIGMFAQVHVEHRETRRVVTLTLDRADREAHGAWIEIVGLDAILEKVLDSDTSAEEADVQFGSSLGEDASYVEQGEDRTWVWFGHFSTQYLEIIVEPPPADASPDQDLDDPETTPPPSQTETIPAAGWSAAVAAVALAAFATANRRRSR